MYIHIILERASESKYNIHLDDGNSVIEKQNEVFAQMFRRNIFIKVHSKFTESLYN